MSSAAAFSCITSKMISVAAVAKGWSPPLVLCSCESRQSAVRLSEQQLKVNSASKQEGSNLRSKARLSCGGIGASDASKSRLILLRSLPLVAISNQDVAPLEDEAPLEVEATLEDEAPLEVEAPPESLDLPVVRVKFLLQKECLFGQKFSVVGEDIILGAWDPIAAFDLDWSKDHTWTGELDVPLGKKYEFKFLLTSEDGEVQWQPGPNRTFETLENALPLIVSEPWCSEETDKIDDVPADVSEALGIPGDTDVGESDLATEATKGILDVKQDETGNGVTDVGEPNLVTEVAKGFLDVKLDESGNGVTVASPIKSVVAAVLQTSTGDTEEQEATEFED